MFNELNKYMNGKIYKIINDVDNDIYIGSTYKHINKRWGQHIADAYDDKNMNKPLYKKIRELGYEHFKIELIKNNPCSSRYFLEQEENVFIKEYGNLNIKGNINVIEKYKKPNENHKGSKKRVFNITDIDENKIQDTNKYIISDIDYFNNIEYITTDILKTNENKIDEIYTKYITKLNIRGLRNNRGNKPITKLKYLLEHILCKTLDKGKQTSYRDKNNMNKPITYYKYNIIPIEL
jgi:hypothetical protein